MMYNQSQITTYTQLSRIPKKKFDEMIIRVSSLPQDNAVPIEIEK